MRSRRHINLQGCRVPLAALSGRLKKKATPGEVFEVPTRFGVISLSHQSHSDEFNPGRFDGDSYDQQERRAQYVSAALLGLPMDLSQWPCTRYTIEVLSAAHTTKQPLKPHNLLGFDAQGFDDLGVNRRGFRQDGTHRTTGSAFDPAGWDIENRSCTGLLRPQAWYDAILDVSPTRSRYLALSPHILPRDPEHQWSLAQRLIALLERHVSCNAPLDSLIVVCNDVLATLYPALTAADRTLKLRPVSSLEAALDVADAIAAASDPEDEEFVQDLVAACLSRRASGRFSLLGIHAGPRGLHAELVREVRAHLVLHRL